MLAALLLNLDVAPPQPEQNSGGGRLLKPQFTGTLRSNSSRAGELKDAIAVIKKVKALPAPVVEKAQQYADDELQVPDFGALQAALSVKRFELQRANDLNPVPEISITLQAIAAILSHLQRDEDDIVAILLSE